MDRRYREARLVCLCGQPAAARRRIATDVPGCKGYRWGYPGAPIGPLTSGIGHCWPGPSASAPAGAVLAADRESRGVGIVDGLLDARALSAVLALVGLLHAPSLALGCILLSLLKFFHGALAPSPLDVRYGRRKQSAYQRTMGCEECSISAGLESATARGDDNGSGSHTRRGC